MIRVIAFALALACCVGLISGVNGALTEVADDLVFTEVVKYGDPSVLDGRVLRAGIECGDHMTWNTTYTFGEEDRFDTEFVFTQENRVSESYGWSGLELYDCAGFGISTDGELEVGDGSFGDMIRTVAAMTPDGGEREMNLKLSDYLDYHVLDLNLDYASEKWICGEFMNVNNRFFEDESGLYCPSYEGLSQLFKFPVLDNEIVTITVEKNASGGISSVGYNSVNGPLIQTITAVNDSGAYLIPVFMKSESDREAIPGEYAYGMGIYFIPWRVETGVTPFTGAASKSATAQRPTVTLDVDRAKNIYPLPETAVVYGLEVDEQSQTAWMLSLENGMYVLTRLDLASGEVLYRLEALAADPEGDSYYPTWYVHEDVMVLEACDNLALVDLSGEPKVDFVVPLGETKEGFWNYELNRGDIWYDGETLILAGRRYYSDYAMSVLAYDATGPLYWGLYECSIFEARNPGVSPYIQNGSDSVVIE